MAEPGTGIRVDLEYLGGAKIDHQQRVGRRMKADPEKMRRRAGDALLPQEVSIMARRAADPAQVPPPPGAWLGAVPLAPEEAARLDAIASLKWPAGVKIPKFRAALLKREFSFVARLIGERKYFVRDAAKLFRLPSQKVTELRGDLTAGVFDAGAPRGVARGEWAHWRRVVRREYARWPHHLGAEAFWRMLRREFGFPGGLRFVRTALRRKVASAQASTPVQPVPTAAEEERLDGIRSARWPRDAADFRKRMLQEHFPFVFGLLDRKVLTLKQSAKLFRVPHNLMTEMRSDYRAGTFAHVLAPPPSPAERRKWLGLVYRELARRAADETPTEFCRRLRVKHGFPLPFASVNQILARERKKHPDGPAKRTEKQSFLRVALSASERSMLRTIARADWDGAADPDVLRRAVLDAYLPFVCDLISGWKLRIVEAAELFRVSEATMAKLRKRSLGDAVLGGPQHNISRSSAGGFPPLAEISQIHAAAHSTA